MHYDAVLGQMEPDYILLVVDVSGSMTKENIQPGYEKLRDDVIKIDWPYAEIREKEFLDPEPWIGEINKAIQEIIDENEN